MNAIFIKFSTSIYVKMTNGLGIYNGWQGSFVKIGFRICTNRVFNILVKYLIRKLAISFLHTEIFCEKLQCFSAKTPLMVFIAQRFWFFVVSSVKPGVGTGILQNAFTMFISSYRYPALQKPWETTKNYLPLLLLLLLTTWRALL